MIKTKKAFSLIEVIFVLVILGIVASISSQIIVQVYENYITQKALYNTTTKTELVANQIVNRLSYVIDGTTIAKDPLNPPYSKATEGDNWIKLEDIPAVDNNFTTVEWIGYDNDSFSAGATPYWSGVADYESVTPNNFGAPYNTPTRNNFSTPGSTLTNVATIMSNLSNGKVQLTNANPAAVIFVQKAKLYRAGLEYDPACMGLINENNTSCIFRVSATDDTNFAFLDAKPKIVTERYKLAWSAYSLVPEDLDGDGLFNLFLYYNYQPWNGEKYTDGSRSLLITDVSVFKFTENGGVIQLKLCASENIGENFNISSCKEKAIIR
jgi:prepilin-type N-terminal cleavage/methylation domain-containing protein